MSSLQGVREVVETQGLFSSRYPDRGSHYWYTEDAGGKVDKMQLTQVHRALQQLGITFIAAYSPEARGRSERAFRMLQDRLPKELALGLNYHNARSQRVSDGAGSARLQPTLCGDGSRSGDRVCAVDLDAPRRDAL
jgi:hypothetical protein